MSKKSLISVFVILLFLASNASFGTDDPVKESTPKLPENVKTIVDKSCFGCHNTDSRNEDAKEELDFKKLDKLSLIKKVSAYKHIGETVEEDEMPPKKFLQKRPEKKLSDEEKNILISWAKKEAEALVKSK